MTYQNGDFLALRGMKYEIIRKNITEHMQQCKLTKALAPKKVYTITLSYLGLHNGGLCRVLKICSSNGAF